MNSCESGSVQAGGEPNLEDVSHHVKVIIFLPARRIVTFSVSCVIDAICLSTEHEKLWREWEAEERAHQVMCDAWNPERQAMIMGKGAWCSGSRGDGGGESNKERATEKRACQCWSWKSTTPGRRINKGLDCLARFKASTKCLRCGTREYSATLSSLVWIVWKNSSSQCASG